MGKKSTKTKSTTSLPAWAQPYATGAAGTISDTVNANQGNLQHISDGIAGQLPGLASTAFGPQPGLGAAQGYASDVLGGKYLNSNPYIDNLVHQGEQDAGNAVNSTFSLAGRTGGGNHATDLARGVAMAGDTVRANEYNQERQNQQQAMGAQPGLTAAQYAGVPAYLSAAQSAATLPYAGLGPLASMGSLWAGTGTTTGTQPGGWGTALLGALAGGASAALGNPAVMSDRRMKRDIVKVGEAKDGLGIYEYSYKFDPDKTRIRGVMADEVKELRPAAYVPNFKGEYAGVNYAALGSLA